MDNNPPSPSRRHGNEDEQDPQNVPLPDSRPESTTTVGQNATLSSQSPRAPPKLDDLETSEDIQSPPPALVTNEVQPEMSHANPPSFPCVAIAVPSSTPPPAATTEKSDSLAARLMKSISSLHLARDPNGIHIVHFPVGGSSSGTTHKKQKHSTKKSNYIRTTKYTVLTFLPLNLYFQFSRVYNVYFLLGALSTLGGTSSISPASMILPLLIVLLFSAIKDAYEDYVRIISRCLKGMDEREFSSL